ncbi:hypothetical protein [Nostocoides australiense]|nr:hypothetical protein [Actinomycetota bacterium]
MTATAALAVGAAVVIPDLGGSGMAHASWTPTPSAVAKTDLDAATAACRDLLASNQRSGPAFDAEAIPVVLAERRGDTTPALRVAAPGWLGCSPWGVPRQRAWTRTRCT